MIVTQNVAQLSYKLLCMDHVHANPKTFLFSSFLFSVWGRGGGIQFYTRLCMDMGNVNCVCVCVCVCAHVLVSDRWEETCFVQLKNAGNSNKKSTINKILDLKSLW